jgi:transposase
MEFKLMVGVDMSKEWFDYCILNRYFEVLEEGRVENNSIAILAFIEHLVKKFNDPGLSGCVLCMEHTGIYVQPLVKAWTAQGARLALVHAQKVSQHLAGPGGWAEKTDRLDARRLAQYGLRFNDQLQLWKATNATLDRLALFEGQRERLTKALNQLQALVKECEDIEEFSLYQDLLQSQKRSVEALKQDLEQVERTLQQIIEQDEELKHLFKLVCSVEGVGAVTARELLVATQCFTRFSPQQAKAFARYCGVIPLKRQSGKAMKKKERTSKRGHKRLKSLLTMGAMALIRTGNELGHYYRRKLKEGKDHLCIINAMRNKILLRVFAVVKNQVMYQKNLNNVLLEP